MLQSEIACTSYVVSHDDLFVFGDRSNQQSNKLGVSTTNEHTTAENSTPIKVMQRTWSCRGYGRRRRSVDAHLAFNGGQASLDLVQNGGEGGKVVLSWHGRLLCLSTEARIRRVAVASFCAKRK